MDKLSQGPVKYMFRHTYDRGVTNAKPSFRLSPYRSRIWIPCTKSCKILVGNWIIILVPDHDTSVFIHLQFITGVRSHLYLRIRDVYTNSVKRIAIACQLLHSRPSPRVLASYIIMERRLEEVISGA